MIYSDTLPPQSPLRLTLWSNFSFRLAAPFPCSGFGTFFAGTPHPFSAFVFAGRAAFVVALSVSLKTPRTPAAYVWTASAGAARAGCAARAKAARLAIASEVNPTNISRTYAFNIPGWCGIGMGASATACRQSISRHGNLRNWRSFMLRGWRCRVLKSSVWWRCSVSKWLDWRMGINIIGLVNHRNKSDFNFLLYFEQRMLG